VVELPAPPPICKVAAVRLVFASLFALVTCASAFDANVTAENKNRPTTFAGVPWGASREDASRLLGSRSGAIAPDPLPADEATKVELTGGTFSNQAVERWVLEFVNRRLAAATIIFKSDTPATGRYRELRQQLTAKYGPPTRDGRPPLALDADKKERRAQQRINPDQKLFGNLVQWKFTPNLLDKEPKSIELVLGAPGGILATDEAQLVVTIRYANDTYLTPAIKPASTPKPPGTDDL